MKKIIGIGLLSAALLAGCGGAQPATGPDTGAATTTAGDDVSAIPTSAVGDTGTTAADATAAATPEDAATGTDANATAAATTVAGAETTAQPTSAAGDTTGATGAATGAATAMPTAATGTEAAGDTAITPGAFQTVTVPELGLSFQVPEGWEQVANENAWSPAGMDVPRIGVNSADLTADWTPSSFLPEGATVRSSQQLTLGGTQTMFYTVENTDGTAETHAIMLSGQKAFDFYVRAESLQDLQTLQPVLNDIVGSVRLEGV
ncbi:MAG TPA: hypothetical protein VNL77_18315 [Roseiflexaceae bacterium]|nr:hypothetical protein [Roseiflexaceae bacterium]